VAVAFLASVFRQLVLPGGANLHRLQERHRHLELQSCPGGTDTAAGLQGYWWLCTLRTEIRAAVYFKRRLLWMLAQQ
jgi:hypothetical protein